jgi:hypothetical protein
MTIFLTVFFGISAIGHTMEYIKSGNTLHLALFVLTVLLALWHGALV